MGRHRLTISCLGIGTIGGLFEWDTAFGFHKMGGNS